MTYTLTSHVPETQIVECLRRAGYTAHSQDTLEAQLTDCFLSYVDGGTWYNLDDIHEVIEDIKYGDITIADMIAALNRMN